MQMAMRLWKDDRGVVISSELVFVATILVIGLVVGMAALRDAVTAELSDVAGAIQDVNQGYTVNGVQGHSAATAGFDYADQIDFCDSPDAIANFMDNCILVDGIVQNEGTGAPVLVP